MFLENLFKEDINITKFAKENCTFTFSYHFWFEHLFERCMLLFDMKNTFNEDTKIGIKAKEITTRLYTNGHCAIAEIPKEYMTKEDTSGQLTAFYGNFYGISKYYDEKPYYNVRCPIWTASLEVDKDVVIIDNTSIRNPITPLIHHYATLLGHTDVSIINILINARDSGGVPIVSTEKQKQSVNSYLSRLFNGQYGVITDKGSLGITYAGTNRNTNQDLLEVMECREKLIKSFYSAIGVRSAFEKRNNSVVAEVESDTSLLQLNLADMLECRKVGFDKVNKMFGTNWSVDLAEEIDYGKQNERIKFAMNEDIHLAKAEDGVALGGESDGNS